MTIKNFNLLALFFALFVMASCNDDDVETPNEEEVINSVTLNLVAEGTTDVVSFTFVDADADGSMAPVITGNTLAANTTYTSSIMFENTIESENVTEEIEEEDEDHQIFYAISGVTVTVAYGDTDADGNPVGLTTTMTTGDAGTGELTVTLIHEPDKSGANVAAGDITNAGGETDIEVKFPVTIQ